MLSQSNAMTAVETSFSKQEFTNDQKMNIIVTTLEFAWIFHHKAHNAEFTDANTTYHLSALLSHLMVSDSSLEKIACGRNEKRIHGGNIGAMNKTQPKMKNGISGMTSEVFPSRALFSIIMLAGNDL